jgi:signal transduction histidine kinase
VVADDGIGFAGETVDRTNHFGLQLMRERIESAGGSVVVDSRLGQGTCVSASIPTDA